MRRTPTVLGRMRLRLRHYPFVCFADISPIRGIFIRPYGGWTSPLGLCESPTVLGRAWNVSPTGSVGASAYLRMQRSPPETRTPPLRDCASPFRSRKFSRLRGRFVKRPYVRDAFITNIFRKSIKNPARTVLGRDFQLILDTIFRNNFPRFVQAFHIPRRIGGACGRQTDGGSPDLRQNIAVIQLCGSFTVYKNAFNRRG